MKRILAFLLVLCGTVALIAGPAVADATLAIVVTSASDALQQAMEDESIYTPSVSEAVITTNGNDKILTLTTSSAITEITGLDFSGVSSSALGKIKPSDLSELAKLAVSGGSTYPFASLETLTVKLTTADTNGMDLSELGSLTTLDLTGSTGLTKLTLASTTTAAATKLATLTLSGCTALTELVLASKGNSSGAAACTSLTTLDVSACTGLTTLTLAVEGAACTDLAELTLPKVTDSTSDNINKLTVTLGAATTGGTTTTYAACTKLRTMDIAGYLNVKELALDGCTRLSSLNAAGCEYLATLSFGGCTGLKTLDVSGTALKETNGFDFTGLTALETLNANGAEDLTLGTTAVDFTGLESLKTVDFGNTSVAGNLNFSDIASLTSIVVSNDTSTAATLSLSNKNTSLTKLILGGWAGLSAIDTGTVGDLTVLSALTELDVSDTAIGVIDVTGLSLTALDVSGCTRLATLKAPSMGIEELDLSEAAQLATLTLSKNALVKLDLSGTAIIDASKVAISGQARTLEVADANLTSFDFAVLDIDEYDMEDFVRNVKDGNGSAPSSTSGSIVTFASAPSKITYNYLTGKTAGSTPISMDVTLTLSEKKDDPTTGTLVISGDSTVSFTTSESPYTMTFEASPDIDVLWSVEVDSGTFEVELSTTTSADATTVTITADAATTGSFTLKAVSDDTVSADKTVEVTITSGGTGSDDVTVSPTTQSDVELGIGDFVELTFTATSSADVTWSAVSSQTGVVTVSPAASTTKATIFTVTGVSSGTSTITLTASNGVGESATLSFNVEVLTPSEEAYRIFGSDLNLATGSSADVAIKAAFGSSYTVEELSKYVSEINEYRTLTDAEKKALSDDHAVTPVTLPGITLTGVPSSNVVLIAKFSGLTASDTNGLVFHGFKDAALSPAAEDLTSDKAVFLDANQKVTTHPTSGTMYVAAEFDNGTYAPAVATRALVRQLWHCLGCSG